MRQTIESKHTRDEKGNPTGGETNGTGLSIHWQNGPLKLNGIVSQPNGAFVEGVIQAAIDRLQFYQESQFKCRENALAITKLEEALHWLDHRTRDRIDRGVEGVYEQ